jgi:cell division protein FtsB
MPKSHDDPDEIDLAQMAREADERAARRLHKAYESSDPPPPPPYRPRQPSIVDIELESHGKRAKHLTAIWGFAALVIAALVAGGVWANTRPSQQDVINGDQKVRDYVDEKNAQIQRLAEGNVRIEQQVKDMRDEDERRWNKLDKILEKQFGQTTSATPPPSFGTAAKAKGKQ